MGARCAAGDKIIDCTRTQPELLNAVYSKTRCRRKNFVPQIRLAISRGIICAVVSIIYHDEFLMRHKNIVGDRLTRVNLSHRFPKDRQSRGRYRNMRTVHQGHRNKETKTGRKRRKGRKVQRRQKENVESGRHGPAIRSAARPRSMNLDPPTDFTCQPQTCQPGSAPQVSARIFRLRQLRYETFPARVATKSSRDSPP